MQDEFSYNSISAPTEFVYKEKGSSFLAFAFPVNSETAFKDRLHALKNDYPDATHHCYAFILNTDRSFQKSSDDGEPGGTAGKPILRAILEKNLTFTGIIVVRYFGGKQLGVPGLIHAYHLAASEALQKATIVEQIIEFIYILHCDLIREGDAFHFVKKTGGRIISIEHLDRLMIQFSVPKRESGVVERLSKEYYYLDVRIVDNGERHDLS